MTHLRKPSQDTLILLGLCAIGSAAAVLEHGAEDGAKVVAGVLYAGCVMTLGFAVWRSLAQRKLRFTAVDWCVATYAVAYALLSLTLGWPFGILTVLGIIIPVVILSVFSAFSRFGWW